MNHKSPSQRRFEMVEKQIVRRGVRDPLVIRAMRTVPRQAFLPESLGQVAYKDTPLPIGADQTISQPYMVALMIEALGLNGGETVLEVGTGSGYAAAVLAEIAGDVVTIERIELLAEKATNTLRELNISNVTVLCRDGTLGCPERAPFDAIVVAAGGPAVPDSLKLQLKKGGCLVIPVGDGPNVQKLVHVKRISETEFVTKSIANVRFVPLIGDEGWEVEG